MPFSPRVLCTVRLSRRLDLEAPGHGLDAVIARHAGDRHRALGDARARGSSRRSSTTPPTLRLRSSGCSASQPAVAAAARRPRRHAPGVYRFYGDNPLPLYVGKSVHLRRRALLRGLASGDRWPALGRDPAHRVRDHRRRSSGVAARVGAHQDAAPGPQPRAAPQGGCRRDDARRHAAGVRGRRSGRSRFGGARPTRRDARCEWRCRHGRVSTGSAGCAWALSGAPARASPASSAAARGACVGEEPAESHDARLRAALASEAIPTVAVEGSGAVTRGLQRGTRVDVHVVRDWHWIGTARDDAELAACSQSPARLASTSTCAASSARLRSRWHLVARALRDRRHRRLGRGTCAHAALPAASTRRRCAGSRADR